MHEPAEMPAEPPSPSLPVVGVAVRDPNVREVLLALIRLNRMQVRGFDGSSPQVEVGPPAPGDSLLVGYFVSNEDAEYFADALRITGGPPSIALVPRDADDRLAEKVARQVTKVVRLPENSQAIADAIRDQLVTTVASSKNSNRPPLTGSRDSV